MDKGQSVRELLGSAIVAPFATTVEVYHFSHNWMEAFKFTSLDEWQIRYVSRGSLANPDPYSAEPDAQYDSAAVDHLHEYIHFDRREPILQV